MPSKKVTQEINEIIDVEIEQFEQEVTAGKYGPRGARHYHDKEFNEMMMRLRIANTPDDTKRKHIPPKGLHGYGSHKYRELRTQELLFERGLVKTKPTLVVEARQRCVELDDYNKKIRKAFKTMSVDATGAEMTELEQLELASALLTKRIASEALVVAMGDPYTVADFEARKTRELQMNDIQKMYNIQKSLRDLMIVVRNELQRRPGMFNGITLNQESTDALDAAKEALALIGIDDDDLTEKVTNDKLHEEETRPRNTD